MKYICEECGSEDIQLRVWFNPNTEEAFGNCQEETLDYRECWCEECRDFKTWILKSER